MLERSRGASSCVYVKVSCSRSQFLDPSVADAAVNGTNRHDVDKDINEINRRTGMLLYNNRMI